MRKGVFELIQKPDVSKTIQMDTENMAKLIMNFSMPAMIGMLASAVYNIVDRIFVGQYSGPDGLAAITLSFPTMIVMFAFALLFSVGGSSRVAILRGAKKQRPAEQALAHTVMLLAFVGIMSAWVSFFGVRWLLMISGASAKIMPLGETYLTIILLGGPLALMGHGVSSLVRACGAPRYAMAAQVTGAIANIALDAYFIAGLGMGVAGAALGTVMAQGAATLAGLAYFFTKSSPLRLRLHFFLRPKLKVIKKICAVGVAPFFVELSFFLIMTVMNNMIYRYGGDMALSALGIFSSLDSLLFLPAMAIGEAAQPIVGYNYGAGKPGRVIDAIKIASMLSTAFYVVSFIFSEIFAPELMALFNNDPELLAIGVPGMRIGYLGIVFVGVPIVTISALQGLGRARESLFLSLFRHAFFMFLPMIILPKFFGIWGVWLAFPVGDVCGSLMSIYFLSRLIKWLKSPAALVVD